MLNLIFKIERYKWNKEYRVYVSNLGHFKDEHKKLIAPLVNKSGYLTIRTPYGLKAAHRLVMKTWKPIPNSEELTVDHLDSNKRNNDLSNLEWVTREENRIRACKNYVNEVNTKNIKKYIIYNKNKELLFVCNNVKDAIKIFKKYYPHDYHNMYNTINNNIYNKFERIAKNNKPLEDKKFGTLLINYK